MPISTQEDGGLPVDDTRTLTAPQGTGNLSLAQREIATTDANNATAIANVTSNAGGALAARTGQIPAIGTGANSGSTMGQTMSQYSDFVGSPEAVAGLGSAFDAAQNPAGFLTPESTLSGQEPVVDVDSGLVGTGSIDGMDSDGLAIGTVVNTAGTVDADNTGATGTQQANSYDTATTGEAVDGALGTAAQGEVDDKAVVDAEQIDMEGTATGYNKDGSVNYTGQALTQFASQNISTMIDTSTVAGKLLAQQLGEGNYTDTKATTMGQLNIISEQFTGPNGEPKIPTWAQGTARNVAKIAAFKGMSGSAATAAMATAIMEATLPIAQDEARFMQTLTEKNLDNRQESVIQRAQVLSKMDQLNLDSRMEAAIVNSKNFMAMDLANLDNEQQMAVVNSQSRVQSILEDAKSLNTQRMFTADAQNDMDKFYDELNTGITKFNVQQQNAMAQFNAGELNTTNKFNADLENNREQFYSTMQYNIDIANSKWRQTVTLTETEMAFEAAATDVQNMFNLSVEAQNQLWDRADAILDYTWKSNETAKDRATRLEEARMGASAAKRAGNMSALGSVVGAIGGAIIM